jgi:hypothetical protein
MVSMFDSKAGRSYGTAPVLSMSLDIDTIVFVETLRQVACPS